MNKILVPKCLHIEILNPDITITKIYDQKATIPYVKCKTEPKCFTEAIKQEIKIKDYNFISTKDTNYYTKDKYSFFYQVPSNYKDYSEKSSTFYEVSYLTTSHNIYTMTFLEKDNVKVYTAIKNSKITADKEWNSIKYKKALSHYLKYKCTFGSFKSNLSPIQLYYKNEFNILFEYIRKINNITLKELKTFIHKIPTILGESFNREACNLFVQCFIDYLVENLDLGHIELDGGLNSIYEGDVNYWSPWFG